MCIHTYKQSPKNQKTTKHTHTHTHVVFTHIYIFNNLPQETCTKRCPLILESSPNLTGSVLLVMLLLPTVPPTPQEYNLPLELTAQVCAPKLSLPQATSMIKMGVVDMVLVFLLLLFSPLRRVFKFSSSSFSLANDSKSVKYSTILGRNTLSLLPCPKAPSLPSPQVYKRPTSVKAQEWYQEQAT